MEHFTLAWVLFTLCLGSVVGKPAKKKSSLLKTIVKRWDLIIENDPILSQNPPADCQNIIDDYSKGKLLMYEYKIQINRCMKKAKGDAAKKMQVPATAGYQAPVLPVQNYNMPAQQPEMPGQQAAFYYPNTAQTPYNGAPVQNPVPEQTQAAFAPNPMNQYPANPAPFQVVDPNMGMNAVAKNTIPDNTQTQQPRASQANAVFDQWRASSFGAAAATRKDETPSAPVAPSSDQFAEFMKLQASTGNAAEASPVSQQAAMPAAMQQRSDVPQLPSLFPAQAQLPNTVPGPSQAFYMQPVEHGDFPWLFMNFSTNHATFHPELVLVTECQVELTIDYELPQSSPLEPGLGLGSSVRVLVDARIDGRDR